MTSAEIIYKVAEEIYIKQDEIKQEIVDLKDLINDNQIENQTQINSLFKILQENAVEMAKLIKIGYGYDEPDDEPKVKPPYSQSYRRKQAIEKLFEKHGQIYINEKLDIYVEHGWDKFRSNYLDEKNRKKIDIWMAIYG